MLGAEWRGTDPPDPVSVTTIMTTPPKLRSLHVDRRNKALDYEHFSIATTPVSNGGRKGPFPYVIQPLRWCEQKYTHVLTDVRLLR